MTEENQNTIQPKEEEPNEKEQNNLVKDNEITKSQGKKGEPWKPKEKFDKKVSNNQSSVVLNDLDKTQQSQVQRDEPIKQQGKKGEPWKPKEKFDKKQTKEILVQQGIQAQTDERRDHIEEETLKPPVASSKQVTFKDDLQLPGQNKQGLVSHLKIYQQHSTQSISLQPGLKIQLLHPTIIQVCLSYQDGSCMGSTYRCVEFLRGLKGFIMDFKTPKASSNFGRALFDQLNGVQQLLGEFRSVNEGMKTAYSYLINILEKLFTLKLRTEEQQLKVWLCQQIDLFVNQKIIIASDLIIFNASPLIRNDMKILVFARSYLVENFLIHQHKLGKRMHVFVVDNPPFSEGKKMFKTLENEGLECSFILLSHVSYIIKTIDKVFVGANSMLSNGALISRVGTAFLACMASSHKVPFHVFCESYKFSEDCQIDSLSKNELQIQGQDVQKQKYKQIGLMYDVTPSQQINMVITEIGLIPPTSVKVIIQEFQKYNYVDKVELPK